MGAIDERFCQVELAAIAQVFSESPKHSLKCPVLNPCLKASMTGLMRWISARQVGPRRTGAKDPHHAIYDVTRIAPRAAALRTRPLPLLARKAAFDRVPLLVGEVHPQP
jgi:hypothetical protein